ncbi:hypothetical protein F4780DRAFT_363398 [Xylariomycetidae sp. FL0641]|nr:hypothetical protein F4780DRAFT_363398 [Xylariomycetidae sp. FL0641]
MTSRFVSGGTIAGDNEGGGGGGGGSPPQSTPATNPPNGPAQRGANDKAAENQTKKNAQWEAVQAELDAERKRRSEARRGVVEGGAGSEKSLYDILQANKAAKQAAFEESTRLRNQFRALDDDEVDFLEGVQDAARAAEAARRRETEAGLAAFRAAQKLQLQGSAEATTTTTTATATTTTAAAENQQAVEEWTPTAGRKRKRDKAGIGVLKGVVKRRVSAGPEKQTGAEGGDAGETKKKPEEEEEKEEKGKEKASAEEAKPTTEEEGKAKEEAAAKPAAAAKPTAAKPKLGLVDYGSDDDDDDDD